MKRFWGIRHLRYYWYRLTMLRYLSRQERLWDVTFLPGDASLAHLLDIWEGKA